MGDDVGGEDHGGAFVRQGADHLFEPPLVDRIEARERLVENDEARFVNQGAEDLHLLRHALRHLPDLAVGGIAEAMLLEQFAPADAPFGKRQAAQCTDEGNRLEGLHRGIEPALLGKVADGVGDIVGALGPKDTAVALVGVDDAEQHAQRRRLSRAVGAEDAVDRALANGEVDPIDSGEAIEAFDQTARFDR